MKQPIGVFARLALVLALIVTAACASVPIKQKAVNTLQANDTVLSQAQDLERQFCDPAKAAVTPTVAITACTGPTATAIGLTDAKHQQFAKALSAAFDLEIKATTALQAWQAGQPPPASLADLQTALVSALAVARGLTPANHNIQSLIDKIDTVLRGVVDTIALVKGH